MKLAALLLPLAFAQPLAAQTPTQTADPWQAVGFLQGTWEAKTGAGSAAHAVGTYVFQKELKEHIVARHSAVSGCIGPDTYDCQHSDLLYLFQNAPGQALKAVYFDNEGHVIHYGVSTPDPYTVMFLSEPGPGPRFRLIYHLDGGVMYGKFQIQMPGKDDWSSYLEWSGGKQ